MGIWFKTGNKMSDGTPRTVYAGNDIEIAEARKKRWVEVGPEDGNEPVGAQGTEVKGVTGTNTRKVGPAHEVFRNELTEDEVATTEEVAEEVVEEVATAEEVAEEIVEEPAVEEEPAEEAAPPKPEVATRKRGRKKKK